MYKRGFYFNSHFQNRHLKSQIFKFPIQILDVIVFKGNLCNKRYNNTIMLTAIE
jgi:hypothetical protein